MTIQKKVEYIQGIAKKLESVFEDESLLYDAINNLKKEDITLLKNIYSENLFSPARNQIAVVNLVRHKVLSLLEQKRKVVGDTLEEIKQNFLDKNLGYFTGYPKDIQKGIENYPIRKMGPFHAWKHDFRILYILLFTPKEKEIINRYLEDLKEYISTQLGLKDFSVHYVNFDGMQNFGATYCWMAFFPKAKVSHTNAYQLFLAIHHDEIKFGIYPGSGIKRMIGRNKKLDIEEIDYTNSITEVVETFKAQLNDVIQYNKTIRQVWKYAPGEQAKHWDEFRKESVAAVGWDDIGDLNQYTTQDEISEALGVSTESNESWNLDLFRNASVGDIVIANKGRKTVVGIGVIRGNYKFYKTRKFFKNIRKVDWLIIKEMTFDSTLFRPDTFSPTLKYPEIRNTYLEKYPELQKTFEQMDEGVLAEVSTDKTSDEIAYYWLNANPSIWNYLDYDVADTQTYTCLNSNGNKRRIYQYFLDVKPGDLMIGYLTSPVQQIVALLEVTKSLFHDDLEGEVIEFKIKKFFENPVDFNIIKTNPDLKEAEIVINNQGSLFHLTEEEYITIQNIIEEFNPKKRPVEKTDKLSDEELIDKSGLDPNIFQTYIELIEDKKQVVFQGAPGTGKTFLAKILAEFLTKDPECLEIIQFHPSYSYEDFVEGYRPSENGGLILQNGIFKDLCHKAAINSKQKYILIIDEINRGDISKIFGELLYLLEYRNEKAKLTYSPLIEFMIPGNLYILGTMNLADRSLALIDYALRRRFNFITLETDYDLIKKMNQKTKLDLELVINNIKNMNSQITANHSLGKDFEIGHSYFLGRLQDQNSMKKLWTYEIKPLLMEYFFDNKDEVDSLENIFFQNV